jgi:hypothetical protein
LVIGAAVILDSYNGGIHQICQKCILDWSNWIVTGIPDYWSILK